MMDESPPSNSIFDVHPKHTNALQPKTMTTPRSASTTPRQRTVVVPTANDLQDPSMSMPVMERPRHHRTSSIPATGFSSSAKKYLHSDAPKPASSSSTFIQLKRQLYNSYSFLMYRLTLQQLLAYGLLIIGMISESMAPAPRYNAPIGIIVFMASSTSDADHRVVVGGLLLGVCMDLVWLLRPQQLAFNGSFHLSIVHVTHVCIVLCALLKLWLAFATYFDLGMEIDEDELSPQSQHHLVWTHIKYFFPRKTLPRRSYLSFEVLMRVLVLIWIHGVCGFLLFLLAVVAIIWYETKPTFQDATLGIPLHVMLLLKSATVLLSYVTATTKMNYYGCLKLSGCHKLAEYDEVSAGDIVVKYDRKWIQKLQRAKAFDLVVGLYTWLVYYTAFHASSLTISANPGLVGVLATTGVVLVIMDIWTPLLILVVARCGSLLHSHHRRGTKDVDPYYPNQVEYEEHGSSSSSSSSSGSESGSSDSGSQSYDSRRTRSSRRRRRRRRSRSSSASSGGSSSSDSYRERRRSRPSSRLVRSANHSSTSRRSAPAPVLVPFKRQNSTPIVDANDLERPELSSRRPSTAMWIRYWDDASNRAYLVHSVTNETVWEMTSARSNRVSASASFPPVSHRTPRDVGRTASFPIKPNEEEDDDKAAHAHEVDMAIPITPKEEKLPRELSDEEFLLRWNTLEDGGSFICRVSRIPPFQELARHLHRQLFVVVSDGLNIANLRTVHFYATVDETATYFLGEFIFDSLSLKLYAKFRCPVEDAMVPFVKRLQLKDIVGAYAPCD